MPHGTRQQPKLSQAPFREQRCWVIKLCNFGSTYSTMVQSYYNSSEITDHLCSNSGVLNRFMNQYLVLPVWFPQYQYHIDRGKQGLLLSRGICYGSPSKLGHLYTVFHGSECQIEAVPLTSIWWQYPKQIVPMPESFKLFKLFIFNGNMFIFKILKV